MAKIKIYRQSPPWDVNLYFLYPVVWMVEDPIEHKTTVCGSFGEACKVTSNLLFEYQKFKDVAHHDSG